MKDLRMNFNEYIERRAEEVFPSVKCSNEYKQGMYEAIDLFNAILAPACIECKYYVMEPASLMGKGICTKNEETVMRSNEFCSRFETAGSIKE